MKIHEPYQPQPEGRTIRGWQPLPALPFLRSHASCTLDAPRHPLVFPRLGRMPALERYLKKPAVHER
jgi:hypothetical protein